MLQYTSEMKISEHSRRYLGKVVCLIPLAFRSRLPKKLTQHLWFKGEFSLPIYPDLKVKLSHQGHQGENELFWYGLNGSHEGKSMEIVIDFVRKMDVKYFFDIGANTGTYGVIAKVIKPSLDVYFFEPQSTALQILQENLRLNNFAGKVLDCALSNYDGEATLYLQKNSGLLYSAVINRNLWFNAQDTEKVTVQARRFESMFHTQEFTGISLFKLDVEFHEIEVLEGIGRMLLVDFAERSGWLIEVLTNELAVALEKVFPASNFNYFNIDDRKKSVRQTPHIEVSDNYNYFVLSKELNITYTKNGGELLL